VVAARHRERPDGGVSVRRGEIHASELRLGDRVMSIIMPGELFDTVGEVGPDWFRYAHYEPRVYWTNDYDQSFIVERPDLRSVIASFVEIYKSEQQSRPDEPS
jgi:hypothetical protein